MCQIPYKINYDIPVNQLSHCQWKSWWFSEKFIDYCNFRETAGHLKLISQEHELYRKYCFSVCECLCVCLLFKKAIACNFCVIKETPKIVIVDSNKKMLLAINISFEAFCYYYLYKNLMLYIWKLSLWLLTMIVSSQNFHTSWEF